MTAEDFDEFAEMHLILHDMVEHGEPIMEGYGTCVYCYVRRERDGIEDHQKECVYARAVDLVNRHRSTVTR